MSDTAIKLILQALGTAATKAALLEVGSTATAVGKEVEASGQKSVAAWVRANEQAKKTGETSQATLAKLREFNRNAQINSGPGVASQFNLVTQAYGQQRLIADFQRMYRQRDAAILRSSNLEQREADKNQANINRELQDYLKLYRQRDAAMTRVADKEERQTFKQIEDFQRMYRQRDAAMARSAARDDRVLNMRTRPGERVDRDQVAALSMDQQMRDRAAAEQTQRIQSIASEARNAGLGLTMAGGAGLVLSSRLSEVSRSAIGANLALQAMMTRRGMGGQFDEARKSAFTMASDAGLPSEQPVTEAMSGLLGFGLNLKQIQTVMPGLIGQSRLYHRTLEEVANQFGKAFSTGNVLMLRRAMMTLGPTQVAQIDAIKRSNMSWAQQQEAILKVLKKSLDEYALKSTEGISAAELAANRFQLQIRQANIEMGKGADAVKTQFYRLGFAIAGASGNAPGLLHVAGALQFIFSGAATAVGGIMTLGSQAVLTKLAFKELGIGGGMSLKSLIGGTKGLIVKLWEFVFGSRATVVAERASMLATEADGDAALTAAGKYDALALAKRKAAGTSVGGGVATVAGDTAAAAGGGGVIARLIAGGGLLGRLLAGGQAVGALSVAEAGAGLTTGYLGLSAAGASAAGYLGYKGLQSVGLVDPTQPFRNRMSTGAHRVWAGLTTGDPFSYDDAMQNQAVVAAVAAGRKRGAAKHKAHLAALAQAAADGRQERAQGAFAMPLDAGRGPANIEPEEGDSGEGDGMAAAAGAGDENPFTDQVRELRRQIADKPANRLYLQHERMEESYQSSVWSEQHAKAAKAAREQAKVQRQQGTNARISAGADSAVTGDEAAGSVDELKSHAALAREQAKRGYQVQLAQLRAAEKAGTINAASGAVQAAKLKAAFDARTLGIGASSAAAAGEVEASAKIAEGEAVAATESGARRLATLRRAYAAARRIRERASSQALTLSTEEVDAAQTALAGAADTLRDERGRYAGSTSRGRGGRGARGNWLATLRGVIARPGRDLRQVNMADSSRMDAMSGLGMGSQSEIAAVIEARARQAAAARVAAANAPVRRSIKATTRLVPHAVRAGDKLTIHWEVEPTTIENGVQAATPALSQIGGAFTG